MSTLPRKHHQDITLHALSSIVIPMIPFTTMRVSSYSLIDKVPKQYLRNVVSLIVCLSLSQVTNNIKDSNKTTHSLQFTDTIASI